MNRTITVIDRGTGIYKDKLPIIFGTYTEDGTGIGLQLVKRILDLRGGYAEVTSTQLGAPTFKYNTSSGELQQIQQYPQGTTFRLYFPKFNVF